MESGGGSWGEGSEEVGSLGERQAKRSVEGEPKVRTRRERGAQRKARHGKANEEGERKSREEE